MSSKEKMMSQSEAWQYVASVFRKVRKRRGHENVVETECGNSGMCFLIESIWVSGKISDRNFYSMIGKIIDEMKKLGNSYFLFPRTKAGAKKRVEFAEKQAKALRKRKRSK